ncbi:hypothetical protein ACKW6Q_08300 [Chryseobacterium kwangjuense]|uniref:Uncharacterized protein n=1 Tax=Chryseobacterium kwangjuense TaxID=267125 RepID=A0ABW9K0W3_9FLAO
MKYQMQQLKKTLKSYSNDLINNHKARSNGLNIIRKRINRGHLPTYILSSSVRIEKMMENKNNRM